MSRKLLIKTKNIEIDPTRRMGITREDLVHLNDKVQSQVRINENNQKASKSIQHERVLGE